MYPGREVYPNAPLEFVAAEVRFPYTPRLRQEDQIQLVADQLNDLVPIFRPEQVQTFTLTTEGSHAESDTLFRLLDKTSTTSVAFQATRIVIETTNYPQFEQFSELVKRSLTALASVHKIAGVERVGLRYIDEIRVPTPILDARDWVKWINPALLATTTLRPEGVVVDTSGVAQYQVGKERYLRFRFAALDRASIIGETVLRRRRNHPPGPFFLLDLDSFWEPRDELPDFDDVKLGEVFDELHEPTGETFQAAITETLKTEVLRRENHGDEGH